MKKGSSKSYLVETIDDAPRQEITGKNIIISFTLYYFFGSNLTIYTKVSYICTGILKDKLACSLAPAIVRKTSLATELYSVLAFSI